MSKVPLQKVRVTGLRQHYKLLMQELHRRGVLEVIENQDFIQSSTAACEDHFGVFDLARIDFALKFLTPYQGKRSRLDAMLSGGKIVLSENDAKDRLKQFSKQSEAVITECEKNEEELVRHRNQLHKIALRRSILEPFKRCKLALAANFASEQTKTWMGTIAIVQEKEFVETLAQQSNLLDLEIFGEQKGRLALRVTVLTEIEREVADILNQFQFESIDFAAECSDFFGATPREALRSLEKEEHELQERIAEINVRSAELAGHLDDLRILYDYNAWRKRKNDLQQKILRTDHVFAFEAWMPADQYDHLDAWIGNAFVGEVLLEQIEPNEDDVAPVLVENKPAIAPFRLITEMFGMPNSSDMDPTPSLAPFFFVSFGLCLSDVGYGLILTSLAAFFLLFGRFSQAAKEGIRLLLFCGIGATIGGVLVGGYFGMTPAQAPEFVLQSDFIQNNQAYLNGEAKDYEGMPFVGQVLDPIKGLGPILFLALSMVVGMLQILVGILLDFANKLRRRDYVDAVCDPLAWFFWLIALTGFALADFVGFLDKELFTNLAIAGAVILVLTQGRDQKNWFLKPISGVLGLYNITGYFSDLLSYSRIMALGLATGLIGFGMNLTASILAEMIPVKPIGVAVALFMILFGHALNFSLSLLGAFVHSGRLQFIEFFGKFYEGGGRRFQPFVRQKKYLHFSNS